MDDLTVCRLSAEALGYKVIEFNNAFNVRIAYIEKVGRWNPLANAEH